MQHLEIGEVVDEDLVGEDDDDSVAAEADALDLRAEGELADAAGQVVVPDHDLVGRVAGVGGGAAADEGEDVAAEEHVDEADAAAGAEVAAEDLAEGVAVVDAEAAVGGGGEAPGVLIEGEVEEGRGLGGVGGLRRLIGIEGLGWGLRHYYWESNE